MNYCKVLTITVLVFLGIVSSYAQSTVRTAGDYKRFVSLNPALVRQNAANLTTLSIDRIAVVEGYAKKENGGLADYYQSDDCLGLGAYTESYYRFNPKIVFFGKLEFGYFTGNNMGGSAMFRPYSAPLNFVEFSADNAGKKNSETYNLVGGIGFDITSSLKLGVKVDYTAYNYSKTRDYRHSNSALDLIASAGVTWVASDIFSAGLNYSYRRNVEEIKFNTFGTTEKLYYTLIDYGAFCGKIQESQAEGPVEKNDPKPLVDDYHGGALQLDFNWGDTKFYNELSFNSRRGHYGQNSTSEILYTTHFAFMAGYSGVLAVKKGRKRHRVALSGGWEFLQNNETLYEKTTKDGVTTVTYYGKNRVLDKTTINVSAGYTAYIGMDGYVPDWQVDVMFDGFSSTSQVNVTYPFYRLQKILSGEVNALVLRNIVSGVNTFSPEVSLRYGMGGGDKAQDLTYADPADKQKKPESMDLYLGRQWEYLTAPQISAGIGFRYSRMTKIGLEWYIKASYNFSKAFNCSYLSNDLRHKALLLVGFVF